MTTLSNERFGKMIEDSHVQQLRDGAGFGIMRNRELDTIERIDYLITDIPSASLLHPIEVQVTTQYAALGKFSTFLKTRSRNRLATSVYLVIPTASELTQSWRCIQKLAYDECQATRHAKDVLALVLDESGARRFTASEYLSHIKEEHRRAGILPGVIGNLDMHTVDIVMSDQGSNIHLSTREIKGRVLRELYAQHARGSVQLQSVPVLVGGKMIRSTFRPMFVKIDPERYKPPPVVRRYSGDRSLAAKHRREFLVNVRLKEAETGY